jgi:tetratricopeptide (TPR) repeat protein
MLQFSLKGRQPLGRQFEPCFNCDKFSLSSPMKGRKGGGNQSANRGRGAARSQEHLAVQNPVNVCTEGKKVGESAMKDECESYMSNGNFESALPLAQELVESDPENLLAHDMLVKCLYNLDRRSEAIEACKRLLKIDPSREGIKSILDELLHPDKWHVMFTGHCPKLETDLRNASTTIAQSQNDENMIKFLQSFCQRLKDTSWRPKPVAECRASDGEVSVDDTPAVKPLEAGNQNREAKLVVERITSGDLAQARELLAAGSVPEDQRITLYRMLISASIRLRDFEKVRDLAAELTPISPDSKLRNSLEKLTRFISAVRQTDPKFIARLSGVIEDGNLLFRDGDYQAAAIKYDSAINDGCRDINVLLNCARAYHALKPPVARLCELCDDILALDPTIFDAYKMKAEFFIESGNYVTAREILSRAAFVIGDTRELVEELESLDKKIAEGKERRQLCAGSRNEVPNVRRVGSHPDDNNVPNLANGPLPCRRPRSTGP